MSKLARGLSLFLGSIFLFNVIETNTFMVKAKNNSTTESNTTKNKFDFKKDFSTTQGDNNWYYNERVNGEVNSMSYNNSVANGTWQGSHSWSRIYAPSSLHPGPTQEAVLTFKAPKDGEILVFGNPKKENLNGDGVRVKIELNSNKVWPLENDWEVIQGKDATGIKHDFELNVKEGDLINFIVDSNGGDISSDNTIWNPKIIYKDGDEILPTLNGFVGNKDIHYMRENYDSIIEEKNPTTWNSTAWKGEEVTSQFILWSELKDINNLTLTASDLKDSNGNIISNENIDLNFIKYVRAEGYMIPDIIDNVNSIDLTGETIQPVWAKVNVPNDIPAGTYTGTVTADSEYCDPLQFQISIEVLDMDLPAPKDWDFHLDLWQNPYAVARYYNVEPWSQEHLNYLKPHLELLRDAGQKVITTTIVKDPWNGQTYDPYDSMVEWTKKIDGTFQFDFTNFDTYVELCLELGIDKQINCYSMVPWENRIFYFDESQNKEVEEKLTPGSAKWQEYWSQFIDALVSHINEKGWQDITYIAMDERPLNDMKAVIELLKDTPLKISGAMNYGNVNDLVDSIDDLCLAIWEINDEFYDIVEHRKELGLNTTYYVCTGSYPNTFTRSKPGEAAWLGWNAAKYKADGFLRWAYDSWVKDPLETTDHTLFESGDCFLVYPDARSSVRFERLKEGIQDNEKINQLLKAHPEWTFEVEQILKELKGGSHDYSVNYGQEVSIAKEKFDNIVKKIINGEEPPKVTPSIQAIVNKNVELNSEFEYTLSIDKVSTLTSGEFLVNFDSNIFDLDKDNNGNINISTPKDFEVISAEELEPGKVKIKTNASNPFTGESDLFTLKFIPKKKINKSEIITNVSLTNSNNETETFDDLISTLKVSGNNLALNKPATSSQSEDAYGRGPEKGNDGDINSRWCAATAGSNHWWQVDLEDVYDLDAVEILWEKDAKYGYEIQVSEDGENWRVAADKSNNLDGSQNDSIILSEENVRYIKVQMKNLPSGNTWASFYEFKAYGELSNPTEPPVETKKPGKAQNLMATDITNNSIKLTWNSPIVGGEVKEYIVYKDGKELTKVSESNAAEFNVTSLKSNTLYGFKIVAVGNDGQKSRPIALNARTLK
ncbi:glycoside hydrolase domain-containing protein [Clostridium tarantellae]|nr:glycoside hydrolase domain-containing protein [Clostridium tarantellae]